MGCGYLTFFCVLMFAVDTSRGRVISSPLRPVDSRQDLQLTVSTGITNTPESIVRHKRDIPVPQLAVVIPVHPDTKQACDDDSNYHKETQQLNTNSIGNNFVRSEQETPAGATEHSDPTDINTNYNYDTDSSASDCKDQTVGALFDQVQSNRLNLLQQLLNAEVLDNILILRNPFRKGCNKRCVKHQITEDKELYKGNSCENTHKVKCNSAGRAPSYACKPRTSYRCQSSNKAGQTKDSELELDKQRVDEITHEYTDNLEGQNDGKIDRNDDKHSVLINNTDVAEENVVNQKKQAQINNNDDIADLHKNSESVLVGGKWKVTEIPNKLIDKAITSENITKYPDMDLSITPSNYEVEKRNNTKELYETEDNLLGMMEIQKKSMDKQDPLRNSIDNSNDLNTFLNLGKSELDWDKIEELVSPRHQESNSDQKEYTDQSPDSGIAKDQSAEHPTTATNNDELKTTTDKPSEILPTNKTETLEHQLSVISKQNGVKDISDSTLPESLQATSQETSHEAPLTANKQTKEASISDSEEPESLLDTNQQTSQERVLDTGKQFNDSKPKEATTLGSTEPKSVISTDKNVIQDIPVITSEQTNKEEFSGESTKLFNNESSQPETLLSTNQQTSQETILTTTGEQAKLGDYGNESSEGASSTQVASDILFNTNQQTSDNTILATGEQTKEDYYTSEPTKVFTPDSAEPESLLSTHQQASQEWQTINIQSNEGENGTEPIQETSANSPEPDTLVGTNQQTVHNTSLDTGNKNNEGDYSSEPTKASTPDTANPELLLSTNQQENEERPHITGEQTKEANYNSEQSNVSIPDSTEPESIIETNQQSNVEIPQGSGKQTKVGNTDNKPSEGSTPFSQEQESLLGTSQQISQGTSLSTGEQTKEDAYSGEPTTESTSDSEKPESQFGINKETSFETASPTSKEKIDVYSIEPTKAFTDLPELESQLGTNQRPSGQEELLDTGTQTNEQDYKSEPKEEAAYDTEKLGTNQPTSQEIPLITSEQMEGDYYNSKPTEASTLELVEPESLLGTNHQTSQEIPMNTDKQTNGGHYGNELTKAPDSAESESLLSTKQDKGPEAPVTYTTQNQEDEYSSELTKAPTYDSQELESLSDTNEHISQEIPLNTGKEHNKEDYSNKSTQTSTVASPEPESLLGTNLYLSQETSLATDKQSGGVDYGSESTEVSNTGTAGPESLLDTNLHSSQETPLTTDKQTSGVDYGSESTEVSNTETAGQEELVGVNQEVSQEIPLTEGKQTNEVTYTNMPTQTSTTVLIEPESELATNRQASQETSLGMSKQTNENSYTTETTQPTTPDTPESELVLGINQQSNMEIPLDDNKQTKESDYTSQPTGATAPDTSDSESLLGINQQSSEEIPLDDNKQTKENGYTSKPTEATAPDTPESELAPGINQQSSEEIPLDDNKQTKENGYTSKPTEATAPDTPESELAPGINQQSSEEIPLDDNKQTKENDYTSQPTEATAPDTSESESLLGINQQSSEEIPLDDNKQTSQPTEATAPDTSESESALGINQQSSEEILPDDNKQTKENDHISQPTEATAPDTSESESALGINQQSSEEIPLDDNKQTKENDYTSQPTEATAPDTSESEALLGINQQSSEEIPLDDNKQTSQPTEATAPDTSESESALGINQQSSIEIPLDDNKQTKENDYSSHPTEATAPDTSESEPVLGTNQQSSEEIPLDDNKQTKENDYSSHPTEATTPDTSEPKPNTSQQKSTEISQTTGKQMNETDFSSDPTQAFSVDTTGPESIFGINQHSDQETPVAISKQTKPNKQRKQTNKIYGSESMDGSTPDTAVSELLPVAKQYASQETLLMSKDDYSTEPTKISNTDSAEPESLSGINQQMSQETILPASKQNVDGDYSSETTQASTPYIAEPKSLLGTNQQTSQDTVLPINKQSNEGDYTSEPTKTYMPDDSVEPSSLAETHDKKYSTSQNISNFMGNYTNEKYYGNEPETAYTPDSSEQDVLASTHDNIYTSHETLLANDTLSKEANSYTQEHTDAQSSVTEDLAMVVNTTKVNKTDNINVINQEAVVLTTPRSIYDYRIDTLPQNSTDSRGKIGFEGSGTLSGSHSNETGNEYSSSEATIYDPSAEEMYNYTNGLANILSMNGTTRDTPGWKRPDILTSTRMNDSYNDESSASHSLLTHNDSSETTEIVLMNDNASPANYTANSQLDEPNILTNTHINETGNEFPTSKETLSPAAIHSMGTSNYKNENKNMLLSNDKDIISDVNDSNSQGLQENMDLYNESDMGNINKTMNGELPETNYKTQYARPTTETQHTLPDEDEKLPMPYAVQNETVLSTPNVENISQNPLTLWFKENILRYLLQHNETSSDEESATEPEQIEMSPIRNLTHVPYSFAPTTGIPATSDKMNYGHFIGNVCVPKKQQNISLVELLTGHFQLEKNNTNIILKQKAQANCSNDSVRHRVFIKNHENENNINHISAVDNLTKQILGDAFNQSFVQNGRESDISNSQDSTDSGVTIQLDNTFSTINTTETIPYSEVNNSNVAQDENKSTHYKRQVTIPTGNIIIDIPNKRTRKDTTNNEHNTKRECLDTILSALYYYYTAHNNTFKSAYSPNTENSLSSGHTTRDESLPIHESPSSKDLNYLNENNYLNDMSNYENKKPASSQTNYMKNENVYSPDDDEYNNFNDHNILFENEEPVSSSVEQEHKITKNCIPKKKTHKILLGKNNSGSNDDDMSKDEIILPNNPLQIDKNLLKKFKTVYSENNKAFTENKQDTTEEFSYNKNVNNAESDALGSQRRLITDLPHTVSEEQRKTEDISTTKEPEGSEYEHYIGSRMDTIINILKSIRDFMVHK